jgi:tetratricopeptide (TPR) repeat protein
VADSHPTNAARSQRVHELGLKLVLLIVITVVAFLGTRMLALTVRHRVAADAARIHEAAERELRAGQVDTALPRLQRAATRDRQNAEYALSYARALHAHGQLEAAERALLQVRAQAPDHPVVNLELARVAAARGDAETALRYYRYALYAPWPQSDGARRVREELVAFLLQQGDRTRAMSELIAARATTPDDAVAHLHLGVLLTEAGDDRLALEEFRRAQQLEPANVTATRAAGDAEYRLGNYRAAARDLTGAGELDADGAQRLAISRAVLALDPLAPRTAPPVRVERVERLVDLTVMTATTCSSANPQALVRLRSLRQTVRSSGGRDLDAISDVVAAANALLRSLTPACDPSAPAVRAILILGERQQDATP